MRPTLLPFLLSLGLLPACTADGGDASDDAGTAGTAGTTGADATGEPTTTGGPVDLNERGVGASASDLCRSAMTHAAQLTQAIAAGDAAAASAAYTATDLQELVQQLDGLADPPRTDDAAIAAHLAVGDPAALAGAGARLHAGLLRHFRDRLSSVESGAEDKFAAWDEAHCLWDGDLRSLAAAGEAATWPGAPDTIVADIEAALAAGHDGLSGEPPATALDDWRVPPSRQVIEKSMFRALHRRVIDRAAAARDGADPVAALEALELFRGLAGRLRGRNTPAIAQIEAILAGDPAAIDPDAILTELDIAFAKRTRNYAEIPAEELGTPGGYKSAVEGRTYAYLLAAGIAARVPAVDIGAFLGEWGAYPDLVRAGDPAAVAPLSARLIEATCAYQTALGVATCTGSDDEKE